LAVHDAAKPAHQPLTFGDVEGVLEEVVRPKLAEFATMERVWGEQAPPPETSRWRANWPVPQHR
jgi:hypothetical protein